MEQHTTNQPRVVAVEAIITRADGTVHDLGAIVRNDPRPLRQFWWRLVGRRLAARRIAAANRYALEHRSE